MPVLARWLCRRKGHVWRYVGSADCGMCMVSIHECERCGARSDRWPPGA